MIQMFVRMFAALTDQHRNFFLGDAGGRVTGQWNLIANIRVSEITQVRGQLHDVPVCVVDGSVARVGHVARLSYYFVRRLD